ncbi:hypothetical protein ACS0TY_020518 [Phlomoides rotata]
MSRCFPFPPPGYEPKARPDDVHLIIKEKEKKRKKHKDKDKKERSKRKENERSEGDHKEKKKRKREKDIDEKDRNKDNQISSEGKKNVLENQNGGELVTDSKPTDAIQDQATFPELGKRTIKDGGAPDNQMVQKITLAEKTNVNKTEPSKMANGQSLNFDARRLGNGHVGNSNGGNRIKIEGGSCKVDKVEKRKDANGRNRYGTVFGEGDDCKNEDMKAKEMNGYRNIVDEGNGCKNEDQNKNTRALDKEEKMKQVRKEKIKQGSSDFNFLLDPKRDGLRRVTKHKELNGFSHGVRPNNTSRPALSCRVEKGAAITTNQKGNHEISSPQSVINNHGISNGLTSSHLIHIKKKMEPCPPPPNTIAKVSPIVNNSSTDEKIPSTLLANGRTIHKADIKELRMNGSAEGGKQTLLENGRTIHKTDIKELRMNGSVEGGKQTLLENGRTNHKTDIKELRMNGSVEGGRQTLLENGRTIHKTDTKELRMNNLEGGKQTLLENGRTIHKTDIKELRMNDSVEGGKQALLENGRTIHKTDIKELRMNGSVEGGKHTTSSKPSSASIKSKKPKPPHPDLKYLNEILSVPHEIELPQCDDEDWLFGCKDKRSKLASSPNQCTKQVWAEAIQLESVGITALPYVIPY